MHSHISRNQKLRNPIFHDDIDGLVAAMTLCAKHRAVLTEWEQRTLAEITERFAQGRPLDRHHHRQIGKLQRKCFRRAGGIG